MITPMEAFFDPRSEFPITVASGITANPVKIENFRPSEYGLMAEVKEGEKYFRYFVPWAGVKFARQEIPAPPAQPPDPPVITR